MPRKQKPVEVEEPKAHGGKRIGAGRKPIRPGGVLRKIFAMTAYHENLLNRSMVKRGIDNRSELFRKLLEEDNVK